METSRAVIDQAVADGSVIYGVSTGFGKLADTAIESDKLGELQLNLLRHTAVGVGDPLPEPVVRAIMLLRANTLAVGNSGVRPLVCERLLEMLNAGLCPKIPAQGSVGASGDLAPLAHLGLTLVGEGEVWYNGAWVPAKSVLPQLGLRPLELMAKEGLALVNGTQMMTGIGALTLLGAGRLVETAEVAGAMSLEAFRGTRGPFAEEVQAVRPHPGQIKTAERLRALLGESSEIADSHSECGKVQDPYSFRCMPQVHGAVRDTLSHVQRVIETEINAVTDNPLVFVGDEGEFEVISAGNFHGAPVAAALDFMAIALTDLAAISERRIANLIDDNVSGLPPFLTPDPGLHSGFMIHQVTAAALVSESKGLAHPASVDTIPTSANKEDHVSMGAWAARKVARVLENAERVTAIELFAAAQGFDLLRPLKSSDPLERAHTMIRDRAAFVEADRVGTPDIDALTKLVRDGAFADLWRGR